MRAQAEVHADPEREVIVRVTTANVEAEGICEDRFVAVGGEIREEQPIAGADPRVAEDVVLPGVSEEVAHRRHPADHLVGGVVDERGILLQGAKLVGMTDQGLEATGERARRRIMARRATIT